MEFPWCFNACALLLFLLIQGATAFNDPLIQLSYGTFLGKYNNQYNITHFRRIPFAAPPTGKNRFRAPQPPFQIKNGTYDSDQAFSMCPQRTINGSEDCLYLGLYSRPWTNFGVKRPVVVFFYGGAFVQGSASFSIPPPGYPTLNVSDENDFVMVYPNYRVNALGFLPGKRIKESEQANLNAGLLDQQFALKWVQKHIHKFGGDPEQVSIWGQSAGGGSVVAQLIANGGETSPKLFQRALTGSPFWPKTYRYDSREAEALYDQMVSLTGCSTAADSLQCLKTVDIQKIRDASLEITTKFRYTTSSYAWAPVIDGEFLREPLSVAAGNGRVNADVVLGMYNTHEGENFTPPGLNRLASSNGSATPFGSWISGFLPALDLRALQEVQELYPAKGITETISYHDQNQRAGLIYRDVVLACPALWVSRAAKRKGWLGEFAIPPSKHASDTIYVSINAPRA
jgi:carboxylesterase type B